MRGDRGASTHFGSPIDYSVQLLYRSMGNGGEISKRGNNNDKNNRNAGKI